MIKGLKMGGYSILLSLICSVSIPTQASAASSVETLQEFDMEQVKVTDPYYVNAFNKDAAYLLKLDPNRLIAGFKAVSEGKDPATATGLNMYGGWEDGWSLLRGHTIGHYLSGMAGAYKQTKGNDITQNNQLKQKIDYTISQLKVYQDASSKGYLFASPEQHFDVIEGKATGGSWVPWYTMHKIIAGLLDVYKYEGNQTALQIASKLGDWTYNRTSTWDATLQRKVLSVEYGGMNDCLYELYKLTNNSKYLTAAHKFDEDSLFTPISNGTDILENLHANTQIPKFIGAVNRYRTLGTDQNLYFNAGQQFWTMVIRDHTYVTGGNSENERFKKAGLLDATRDNINDESCNSYNMLKLTRDLFKITGDVKYSDYYEKTYINEIMSAINPDTGMTTYFKPMGTGYFKVFGSETNSFWCCTGTGMENYTKLNDSLYFHNANELYVNMYLSSTLNWTQKGLSLTQAANLPLSNKVTFTINTAPDSAVNIKFRSPSWVAAGQNVSIVINGQLFSTSKVNGYLNVNRVWKAGDKVELTFPMEVQVSRLPDNKNAVAFSYGPVVLSAGLGTEQMVSTSHMASVKATIPAGVNIKDYILVQADAVDNWIKDIKNNLVQTPGKLEFTLRNTDEDNNLKFTPYYAEHTSRYGIYFKLSVANSTDLQNAILNSKNATKMTEAIIDEVQITNDQHELVHNLQGNSSGGSFGGYSYRDAHGTNDGEGWFSYDMKVNPLVTNYISTKYYSGDAGRTFNIYIDNQLLVAETIQKQTTTGFYDVRYKIPAAAIVGKSKITVKFANRGASYVGGVFGSVYILKDYINNANLSSITVNGIATTLSGDIYTSSVASNATQAVIKFTPAQKNALVYVNDTLINDTVTKTVALPTENTSLTIKVVAEDGITTKIYTLNISKLKNTVKLSDGWYFIKNVNAQKYLQVANNIGKAAQNVEIGTATGVDGQKWYLTNLADGYVTLKSALGEYMLDVNNAANTDGANIQIYNANSNNAQKYSIKSSLTNGAYAIATMVSNETKVLDDANSGTSDGTNVCQWTYGGRNNQLWVFEPTSNTTYKLGDLNKSGSIDIIDCIQLKELILNGYSDSDLLLADMNGDKKLNIIDYVQLKKLINN